MSQEEVIVQHTWKELMHLTFEILNYPLFELDGHPVSLGKLVTGVFMLIFSYYISRRASKEVDRRLFVRMNLDDSIRYTMRKFLFYFFVFVTTMFTLHTLAVPITIFTVIGGALAVGVGFGSQNLVNNFISGVLVMLERPMRVGDYIEVDGVTGQVESVGIRTTTMRAGFNSLMTIPNTVFIEKKLTNWTLSERIVSSIRITVAHGTDTARVRDLCLQAVSEQAAALKDPAPGALLSDLGESGMIFDIQYNLAAYDFPNKGGTDSAIRLRLLELFAQNKIAAPVPRRQIYVQQPAGGSTLM